MLLKLRRSQRDSGVLTKTVVFCLDAWVEFTPEEQQHIVRYKLQNQVIYNSEASKQYLARSEAAQREGTVRGSLRGLALAAMAATRLNISIASLHRGQRVECKSLDELLGAQEAIMTACENLKGYLDTAATFDGREVLFDFSTGVPELVAQAPGLVLTPAVPLPAPTSEARPSFDEALREPSLGSSIPQPLGVPGEQPTGMSSGQQLALIVSGLVAFLLFLWILGQSRSGQIYYR
jgi:hypothetical protein